MEEGVWWFPKIRCLDSSLFPVSQYLSSPFLETMAYFLLLPMMDQCCLFPAFVAVNCLWLPLGYRAHILTTIG